MSNWIRGCPRETVQRALVFVDADNLLIQDDCPYTPMFSVGGALNQVVTFSRQVADDPGIYAFVDMKRAHPNSNRDELAEECEHRGIRVIHMPSNKNGKDQVDTGIINEWFSQHRNLPLSVPFVLISLDKDFIPMLEETKRDGRPIYIGMPTHLFYPPHVEAFNGFGWLDSQADHHRAMCFLLNPDGARARPEFELKFERIYPDYRRWQAAFETLSGAILEQPNRVFEKLPALMEFLVATWQPLDLGPQDIQMVLPYLIWYSYLIQQDGIWSPDFDHRLLCRPEPSTVAQP
jgi:hypothetical protein